MNNKKAITTIVTLFMLIFAYKAATYTEPKEYIIVFGKQMEKFKEESGCKYYRHADIKYVVKKCE